MELELAVYRFRVACSGMLAVFLALGDHRYQVIQR